MYYYIMTSPCFLFTKSHYFSNKYYFKYKYASHCFAPPPLQHGIYTADRVFESIGQKTVILKRLTRLYRNLVFSHFFTCPRVHQFTFTECILQERKKVGILRQKISEEREREKGRERKREGERKMVILIFSSSLFRCSHILQ